MPTTDEGPSEVEQTYVWGTTVNVNDCSQRFRRFIRNFEKEDSMGEVAYYVAMLQEILEKESTIINLDCQNLHAYDPDLYKQLVAYPQEIIPIFDIVINDESNAMLRESMGNEAEEVQITVRTYNLLATKNMRDLNPTDIDTMVSVRGMATRVSGIIPDLKTAFFKCLVCGHNPEPQHVDRGRIQEPVQCARPQCAAKFCMQLVHNRCTFSNRQQVKMQETPDAMPEGETPHTVNLCLFDAMVDNAKPGDRVEVTGIYRAVPIKTSSNRRALKSVYKTYLDVIHVRKDTSGRLKNEAADEEAAQEYKEGDQVARFTEEEVAQFTEIAGHPDVYGRLVDSMAPSIWEMEDIKKGILCLLFGGANQDGAGQNGKFRGEINCLLVGDPGVSKSQLLSYVHKIAPRGIYTSGRGSSAVGLTAYVTKDPETREMVLESGALVLSDKGVCCIDEFDKMSDNARSMLHEVMEQQTVSVAKAGIIATLNARTSVLASANPIGSRYNPNMTVVDNIQLPPTLLSRFDLIYLILDKADQARDRKLAQHLISLHFPTAPEAPEAVVGQATLSAYISYARAMVQPRMTENAKGDLITGYVEMRRLGGHKKVITATPRQLESMIRISEALARMRLSETVEQHDVKEALRLMKAAMKQSMTDPNTGLIDMDNMFTGKTSQARNQMRMLAEAVMNVLQQGDAGGMSLTAIAEQITKEAMECSAADVREALQPLLDEDKAVFKNGKASARGGSVAA